jgi:hypothetical protein
LLVGGTGGTGTSGTGGTITFGGTSNTTGAQPNGGGPPIDPPGPTRCGGLECPAPLACCLSNSVCYDPASEQLACPYPPYVPDGEDAPPCASNNHCNPDQYCQLPLGTPCQGVGHCKSRINCPASGYQVCACDGNSYAGLEAACHAGVNVSYLASAACGQTIAANGGEFMPPRWITLCGSDAHCGPGERCCHLSNVCYPITDPGRCQLTPGTRYPCTADEQCLPEYEYCAGAGCGTPGGCRSRQNDECGLRFVPVCGCNGITYTSADCAEQDGTRVAHSDECSGGGARSE